MKNERDCAEEGFIIDDGRLLDYKGKNEDVVIPSGVRVICDHALGCNVKKIFLPSSLEKLEPNAFFYCTDLEEIEVAADNPYYYSRDNCLIERATAKIIKGTRLSYIPQDGSVTAIGEGAFIGMDCTRYCIRDCITTIESRAFGCGTDVTICIESETKPDGWADDWDSNEGELWEEVDWECGCACILLEWGKIFTDDD